MPKIKGITVAQRLENNIIYLKGRHTVSEMAKIMGLKSSQSYYNKLDNPNSITVQELRNLSSYFGVSISELLGETK